MIMPLISLPLVAQRLHKQGEGGRMLSSARIVEMISGERRAPIFEHADETPFGNVACDLALEHVCQTKAVKRRRFQHFPIIENDRPIDSDLQLFAITFEFPGEETTA